MAKPQVENGYTPIANEIMERLVLLPLPSNQWRVLLYIIRKTYGYHKKVDYIANFQIGEATGLCKAVVSRCLRGLTEIQLIIRKGKYIGFQKDWEKWRTPLEPLAPGLKPNPRRIQKRRIVRPDGYIGIWRGTVEPKYQSMATKQGYILEHRLIIAMKLGRCLEPWEVVHHKDSIPSNNNEDNLQLLPTQKEHMPSILARQRIKRLELKLAELQTIVDNNKLAESSTKVSNPENKLAESSTKVSSCAVTQKKKETIQKKKEIPEWIDKEIWSGYLEMRKKKRSAPTDKAIELIIKELEKLKSERNDPNKVLEQSIMNNWTGVFPLKKGNNPKALVREYTPDD